MAEHRAHQRSLEGAVFMGLTRNSHQGGPVNGPLLIAKEAESDRVIALAGNPNVGKSTVFNALTGMNQHTGNWPGKTVASAQGRHVYREQGYIIVDLPGTYSLMAHSAEEEVARNFICFGRADATVVVCDATCLERNLNLVLQAIEITPRVIVCVNLMDEAKRQGIRINLNRLEEMLGVPVVGASARSGKGLESLSEQISRSVNGETSKAPIKIVYTAPIEEALQTLTPVVEEKLISLEKPISSRWVALQMLEADEGLHQPLADYLGFDLSQDEAIQKTLAGLSAIFERYGLPLARLQDKVVSCLVRTAERICRSTVSCQRSDYNAWDRRLDRLLTSRFTGLPVMLLLLGFIFWLTITGANELSQWLSTGLFWIGDRLTEGLLWLGTPPWVESLLVQGGYRVLAWVVSVMLPPMAIFFPLFTLLEDFGYLPRVAFNLDHSFQKAHTCGKQALTICMGFGCNAAGVIGCRIIDSPRERLIAILTNNFAPCNGRLPTIIALIAMFFASGVIAPLQSAVSAFLLVGVIVLGVGITFLVSRLLSGTILKGIPSSFALELPPYRRPQIGRVILRSVFDRTLFVLGRAAAVAAPAGLVIWLFANIEISGQSLLLHCAQFLDPLARLMGLDGVILFAFILGFPANEIVIPIILMSYMATGHLIDFESYSALKELLVANGWTPLTAVCTILFSLLHWPCSTTCLTIHKETGSWKWTAAAMLIPTLIGVGACMLITMLTRIIC